MALGEGVLILEEPQLEFRYGQRLQDPRNGLALFGPFDGDRPSRPGNVPYGIVGTRKGIAAFQRFAARLASPIVPDATTHHHRIWRPYPGFDAAFAANWPTEGAWMHELDPQQLIDASRRGDEHRRAYEATNLYLEGLDAAAQRDEELGLVFCVIPDEVHQHCRPKSTVSPDVRTAPRPSVRERKHRMAGQGGLFDAFDPMQYRYSVDFRRQLKARAMAYGLPLQLLLESTLRLPGDDSDDGPRRDLTPLSDRAWNVTTTAYYKAGGKPWRLASARDGVCYIGLAFRRTESKADERSACCAAQMFLDTGDGVVFKGEYGPWFSEREGGFHLSADAARSLLAGVIETYQQLGGRELKEVFLHSRSTINEEEFSGYEAAVPDGAKLVGVRVRPERGEGLRLFRPGKYPVIRGTLWQMNERTAFLWGSGFRPVLATYPGSEVPLPIRIDIERGEADITQVARDILGLTKLNYNSCRTGDKLPVTVGFSDKVGEILIGNRTIDAARPQFKYYI